MKVGNQKKYEVFAIIIVIAIYLFLFQSVLAIEVSEGVQFQTNGTNTTFITGKNFTWDGIEVHSTYLLLGNKTISVSPSTGSANVTIYNFTSNIIDLNVSADPSANLTFTIGNLTTNTNYTVYNDSQFYTTCEANGTGYLNFTYTECGEHFFTIQVSKADGSSCSENWECSGSYCVHGICRSSSTYCGDGYCDSGETCSSCPVDCGDCGGTPGDGVPGGAFPGPPEEPGDQDGDNLSEVLCESSEKRCVENNLEQCNVNGTGWISIETCEYGCDPEGLECKPEPGKVCEPGEKKCLDSELQQCSSDGSEWVLIETCQYGCDPENLECETESYMTWIYLLILVVLWVIVLGLLYWIGVIGI